MKIKLLIVLLMFAVGAQAQKKKTTTKKKAKTTKVTKKPAAVVAVPLDAIVGKAYSGKIGQTVVDFFGTRNVYGDVNQEVYIWNDSIACIRQVNGNIEEYLFPSFTYSNNTLKMGDYTYTAAAEGASLQLQTMKQNNEKREGKLSSTSTGDILATFFARGKYLVGMTEQTDEDKRNARICLTAAAEGNVEGAKQFLADYYKKLAENGETDAIIYMMNSEAAAGRFSSAHGYIDQLIDKYPDNLDYQFDKGMLYVNEKKDSAAKKLWKKLTKKNPSYTASSKHPFCQKMR